MNLARREGKLFYFTSKCSFASSVRLRLLDASGCFEVKHWIVLRILWIRCRARVDGCGLCAVYSLAIEIVDYRLRITGHCVPFIA